MESCGNGELNVSHQNNKIQGAQLFGGSWEDPDNVKFKIQE